ncbi:hypothetical protein ACYFX5_00315 [Bremerella sp. T1]|uniref:hypothetical protein n=1 Tax=Bremerella sp. TYQ1 TaxID=3119568 RepID=UPI001CC90311|nr:hypothetical protein [Bremerella volcania]UBM36734.1 hypothetical protein LA756_02275 [Bremerella volcania]
MVTVVGTVVTLAGTAVTIWQATQARTYRNQLKSDIRKFGLTTVIERLKRAQDEIRRLPTSNKNKARGVRPQELIQKIREHFDHALGTIDAGGPDASLRSLLTGGQTKLNSYEVSWNAGDPAAEDVHELQAKMQDAVSELNAIIYQLEGKA